MQFIHALNIEISIDIFLYLNDFMNSSKLIFQKYIALLTSLSEDLLKLYVSYSGAIQLKFVDDGFEYKFLEDFN